MFVPEKEEVKIKYEMADYIRNRKIDTYCISENEKLKMIFILKKYIRERYLIM